MTPSAYRRAFGSREAATNVQATAIFARAMKWQRGEAPTRVCFTLAVRSRNSRDTQQVAAAPQCDAKRVLQSMRAASGGSNWHNVAEIAAYGKRRYRDFAARLVLTTYFLRAGRVPKRLTFLHRHAIQRRDIRRRDDRAQDMSGGVRPHDSPYAREQAVTPKLILLAAGTSTHNRRRRYACRTALPMDILRW